MIIRDHLSGDVHKDLAQMTKESIERHSEPANPLEFIQWVRESLREHQQNYERMAGDHKDLVKAADTATIGLKRLEALVKYFKRDELEHLQNMHRTFVHNNRGIGYLLEKCTKVLGETTTTWQLVGETLVQPLADRHKKIGMQKEIGLRLRDVQYYFDRCQEAIDAETQRNRQLTEGIQKLMHEASVKLPPATQKQMEMEDQVKQLALDYSISLKKGKDRLNPAKATAASAGKLKHLGEGAPAQTRRDDAPVSPTPPAPASNTPANTEVTLTTDNSKRYIYGGLAMAGGLVIGCLLFSK